MKAIVLNETRPLFRGSTRTAAIMEKGDERLTKLAPADQETIRELFDALERMEDCFLRSGPFTMIRLDEGLEAPRPPRYAELEVSGFTTHQGHDALALSLRAWSDEHGKYVSLGELAFDMNRMKGSATLF